MTWQSKPTDFIKTINIDCETHIRKIVAVGLQSVVMSSPVMDGAYRGNHRITINQIDNGFDENLQDLLGNTTTTKGMQEIAKIKIGDTAYIQNNAPYSLRLENGWSQQAPQGIYIIAFQNMSSFK